LKRVAFGLWILLAVFVSACAVADPRPRTGLSDTSVTLNANVISTIDGPTDYWFVYGPAGDPENWAETAHETLQIDDRDAHPVSAPLTGLTPDTAYGWQICVADREKDPPRTLCSKRQAFTTRPVGAPPRLYVAIGDSVTQVGDSQRYPERFFNYLDGADQTDVLANLGLNAETSSGLNQPGHGLANARNEIDDPDTDTTVATVDIGGNDLRLNQSCDPQRSTFNLTRCQSVLARFETNFAFTLDSLNSSLAGDPGHEQLLVFAYYNPWSGRQNPPSQAEADRAELALLGSDHKLDCAATGEQLGLNDRIACIAATHQARLANAYPPFIGHGDDYFYDVIHPNGTGHQLVADLFAQAFEAASP
jgi:lysophospholipase L1-like esterase